MSEEHPGTARFIFSKADGYKLVPATGAWGGISPQREIIVDFYIDQRQIPEYLDAEIVDGHQVSERRHPDPQPIDRQIQFGIILRPDIARSIGEFLITKANEVLEGAKE